ncbi:substrate-binding periplasmic protein [Methylotuvimicrobium buryatense]|uniref:Transporter substrate-binding domain-containing protein n=1 Tax=Methylotuvimicrobium buryatense TaxID=95641 RepID=A0A4P9UPT6_METBY|nr:transporter substrate-binding domain-containing protein [Methylotuvimicrobium buryatense]QCW82251.1 transporter substrate-binding domain-containing protein [Methylotuvimicrobium buryatense]
MKFTKNPFRLSIALIAILLFSANSSATGPRIKLDMFTDSANVIYALDGPPLITTQLSGGGVALELVNTIMERQNIQAPINTLPLSRMLKYYMFQENALALVGSPLSFTEDQQKSLIFIPLLRLQDHYFIYRPNQSEGFPWSGDLKALAGRVYGANPEEDVSAYRQAGIKTITGNTLNLLERLKSGSVDFIGDTELTVDWFLDKNLSTEKPRFIKLEPAAGERNLSIIFNKKHPEGESLAKQFRQGLDAIIADGTYQKILEQAFGENKAVSTSVLPLK